MSPRRNVNDENVKAEIEHLESLDVESLSPAERKKVYQRLYYLRNLKQRRKYKSEKYHTDKEYRDTSKRRAEQHYWFKARPQKLKPKPRTPLDELEPATEITVHVDNVADRRDGKQITVPVYTTAAVSRLVGRAQLTVRIWERDGVLPPPHYRTDDVDVTFRGRQVRLYTQDEMRAIEQAAPLLDLPTKSMTESLFARVLKARFRELPQGLDLIEK